MTIKTWSVVLPTAVFFAQMLGALVIAAHSEWLFQGSGTFPVGTNPVIGSAWLV